jgi:hypothetical protein
MLIKFPVTNTRLRPAVALCTTRTGIGRSVTFSPIDMTANDDANRPGRHQMQCASSENANEPILAANACPILVPKTD